MWSIWKVTGDSGGRSWRRMTDKINCPRSGHRVNEAAQGPITVQRVGRWPRPPTICVPSREEQPDQAAHLCELHRKRPVLPAFRSPDERDCVPVNWRVKGHTCRTLRCFVVVSDGGGGRRPRSCDWVADSLSAGLSVAEFARRHDVHPNLLHVWRRQAQTGELSVARDTGAGFVPVSVADESGTVGLATATSSIAGRSGRRCQPRWSSSTPRRCRCCRW
jgi:hypothetical protein